MHLDNPGEDGRPCSTRMPYSAPVHFRAFGASGMNTSESLTNELREIVIYVVDQLLDLMSYLARTLDDSAESLCYK